MTEQRVNLEIGGSIMIMVLRFWIPIVVSRAVAADRSQPHIPRWEDKIISSFSGSFSQFVHQMFVIFFLNLVFLVNGSPTQEGPDYSTE